MWLLNWFNKFFFHDEIKITTPAKNQKRHLYQQQIDYLVERLEEQLLVPVTYRFEEEGKISFIDINGVDEIQLSFFYKGNSVHIMVQLEPEWRHLDCWFVSAFFMVSKNICFRRPVLRLHQNQKLPREL